MDLPAGTDRAVVTLYYQSLPRGYIEYLREANTTEQWGETLHMLWPQTGGGAQQSGARGARIAARLTCVKARGTRSKPTSALHPIWHPPMSHDVLERARQAIHKHDPSATVELTDGALQVESVLPAGTLVSLLRANQIQTAESAPSDCCGGCCGG